MNDFIIAIDFDDTIAKLTPDLVPTTLVPDADTVINYLHDIGCFIIIWTCRSKKYIPSMIKFLEDKKIKYDAINKNAPWNHFTDSPKAFCHLSIDDTGLCEINWKQIKEIAKQRITKEKAKNVAKEILNEKVNVLK
jgi:hypothetical protein